MRSKFATLQYLVVPWGFQCDGRDDMRTFHTHVRADVFTKRSSLSHINAYLQGSSKESRYYPLCGQADFVDVELFFNLFSGHRRHHSRVRRPLFSNALPPQPLVAILEKFTLRADKSSVGEDVANFNVGRTCPFENGNTSHQIHLSA